MKKVFLFVALLCAVSACAQYTPVASTALQDGSGNLFTSAQVCFLPVAPSTSTPIPFNVNGTGGLALPAPTSCGTITNGVLASGIKVADSNLTKPQNVAYNIQVTDNISGQIYTVGPTQISCTATPLVSNCSGAGGTWSLDGYQPILIPLALIQTGPVGAAGPACSTGSGTCNMTVPINAPGANISGPVTATSANVSGPVAGTTIATNLNGADSTGSADVSTAVNAAIAANVRRILLPSGRYYVPSLSNVRGVLVDGDGVLTGTVNQIAQNGASQTVTATKAQVSSYSTLGRFIAGMEYMVRWMSLVQSAWAGNYSPGKIVFSGDSTTSGVNVSGFYTVDKMLTLGLQALGIPSMTTINAGHSGMASSDWLNTYLAADQLLNPDVYVIRWCINDGNLPPANCIANIRAGLAQIRASHSVDAETIVLEMPSSTNDGPNGRDAFFYEQLRNGLAQAARDYQAVFIDLYGLMQDSGPSNNTCWMDLPYVGVGTSTPPIHIHPGPCKQALYTSYLLDVLVPSGTRGLAANLFVNIPYGDVSTITASILPGNFGHGMSWYRATTANGWPVDGFVETLSHYDGDVVQFDFPNTSTTASYKFRAGNTAGWGPWATIGLDPWTVTNPVPTCQTGTATSISSAVRMNIIGKSAQVNVTVTDTTNGTCAGTLAVTLPFTPKTTSLISCKETAVTGYMGVGLASTASLNITKWDNTTLAGTGAVIVCEGVMETQ